MESRLIDMDPLPINAIEGELDEALSRGPVVVTSPTGSGKSTQVPRWCRRHGRVLVVEPRRVACRSLEAREEVPRGALAREALCDLFLRGDVFAQCVKPTLERLEAIGLLRRLIDAGLSEDLIEWHGEELSTIEHTVHHLEPRDWVLGQLEAVGLDSGDDLALLTDDDLLPPTLPEPVRQWLDRRFPRQLSFGDVRYEIEYDIEANEVTLRKVQGQRQEPPPLSWLPSFPGFRVVLRDRSRVFVIRE